MGSSVKDNSSDRGQDGPSPSPSPSSDSDSFLDCTGVLEPEYGDKQAGKGIINSSKTSFNRFLHVLYLHVGWALIRNSKATPTRVG